MKKLLAMLLILVVLAGAMAVSASAASNKTGYCEKCETEVTWEPIVWGKVTIPDGQTTVHKHYYCDKDYANASQIILKGGMSACIDLNGKQIVFPGGRGFIVNGATADTPAALSIQDSAGGATVTSHSYRYLNDDGTVSSQSSNGAAGVLWIDNYCTLDIYGGTYRLDVKTPDTLQTGSGGIIALYNTDTYCESPRRRGGYPGQLRDECLRRYHQAGHCAYGQLCQYLCQQHQRRYAEPL